MALADPQVITVNAVAKSMPKQINDGTHSFYQLGDMTFSLDIKHRSVVRDKKRRVISTSVFSQRKIVADPLTAANDYDFQSTSIQFDRPEVGFTSTELDQQWAGHKAWLDSTMVTKLYERQS